MNKKKKVILFSVLSVILVASISLSIVFLKPFRSQPDSSTSSEASQSIGSGNKVGSLNGVSYSENDGMLVYAYGRLQIPVTGDKKTLGMLDAKNEPVYNTTASVNKTFGDKDAVITQSWDNGSSLTTTLTSQSDGSMVLMQKASAGDKGISGTRFCITVPMTYDVIIPAWDGIRLSKEHPSIYGEVTRLAYPREWQAQMLLIQGTNGGLLINALDNGSQFKALNITNDGTNFYVEIETIPQAPFTNYKEFETVQWKMTPYKGEWMNGALLYRDYANETFNLSEIKKAYEANWVDGIQLVCLTGLKDKTMLDELAKVCKPSQTLLQVDDWRAKSYDTAYPDYTPKEGIKEMIAYAHSLGFKVSIHCNMIGAHLDTEEYKAGLTDQNSLNAFTQEPMIEKYAAYGTTYAFGQINQASVKWQDILVEKFTAAVKALNVDCIHLDQSLICFNDGRGLVNGMTSMQGNVELQRRLAEALPGVAFSGEGINEYNMRYANFLQQHVYGLNSLTQSWSDEAMKQICPLTTALFGDYMTTYHYPALPTTMEGSEEYYQAWYRAGNQRAGHIPCLYHLSPEELKTPTETLKMILEDVKFYQENQPKLNLTEWDDGVVLSMKLKNGTVAEWREDEYGSVFYPDTRDKNKTTTRFISGVEKAKAKGSIKNWGIYDDDFISGLVSSKSYLCLSTARSSTAMHIYNLENNLTTRVLQETDTYAAFALQEIVPTNRKVTDFTSFSGTMRAGEVLDDGKTDNTGDFNSLNAFWYTMSAQAQVRHLGDRFLMHPPWKDEESTIGYTWMEMDTTLEVIGNSTFSASVQLASAANAALSDGVTYKIFIWEKGDDNKTGMVTVTANATSEVGIPISLDITKFEGKSVTVRFEAWPNNTCNNDSSVIVSPQIVQNKEKVEKQISYDVVTTKAVSEVISVSGKATLKDLGNKRYRITSDLNDTVFLIYKATALSSFTDLTIQPFVSVWETATGESSAPLGDLTPSETVAEVCYQLRNGLFAVPPTGGRSTVNYLITLPSGSMKFHTALGLKKGANNSNGVLFGVKVDGTQLFEKAVNPGTPFEEISVDLSKYAGKTVLLTLYTDAQGDSSYDYAFWGDPVIQQ